MTVAFIVLWVVAVASIVAAAYFAVHLVEDGAVNATVFIASYLAEQAADRGRPPQGALPAGEGAAARRRRVRP
jgi:hypothetical protein